MKAIGIDIGTTTISAAVFDYDKKTVLEARTLSNDSFIKTEYEWERIQDAGRIIDKAKGVLDELLERHPDTASIGLTGQMHGILYVDKAGKCISPLYTWQDQRGDLPDFDGRSFTDLVKETCGDTIPSGYGLVTHACLYKKDLVPEGACLLCTIPDYLGMTLTGRERPLLHISMAASIGFFDAGNHVFCKEKLEKLGMSTEILPDVTTCFSVLGTYKGYPVTAAIGDNQASFLGAAGLNENTVLLNVGTGSQISVMSKRFFETEGIEARPLTGDTYVLAGSSLCGGRAYAILEKFFRKYMEAAGAGDHAQYDVMGRLAEAAQERIKREEKDREEEKNSAAGGGKSRDAASDSVKVVTTFRGTRVDPMLRGSILNLSEDNFTPEDLTYGVLKGIAQELYDMYDRIYKGTGIETKKLIASGNGVRKNAVLRRIFEQVFGLELQLAQYEEEAACGAALSSVMPGV